MVSGTQAQIHNPLGWSQISQETNFTRMFCVIWTTLSLINVFSPHVLKRTESVWIFMSGVFIKEKTHLISLQAGLFFYHFSYFHWGRDKLFPVRFLTLKSYFSSDVSGRCALYSLFSPFPACTPHELRETFLSFLWHIVLLWFILYTSTSLPFRAFLSHPFYPLVALAHCPFVSRGCRQKDARMHA